MKFNFHKIDFPIQPLVWEKEAFVLEEEVGQSPVNKCFPFSEINVMVMRRCGDLCVYLAK